LPCDLQHCDPASIEPLIIEIDESKWETEKNKANVRPQSDAKRKVIKMEIDKKVSAGVKRQSIVSFWSQIHMVSKTMDTFRSPFNVMNNYGLY
jgi:hypothetical protein